MSEDLRVNITRAGVTNPIAQNIIVICEKLTAAEAVSYQGSDPHFTYRAFTTDLSTLNNQLILFRDYMIDLTTIDALTGTFRKFLIITDPEVHIADNHWQWVCVRMRGT